MNQINFEDDQTEILDKTDDIGKLANKIKEMQKEIKDLRNDAKKSCNILKVKDCKFYDFPDNEMDSVPLLKIVKVIEKEIKETKPDRIYTHHFYKCL